MTAGAFVLLLMETAPIRPDAGRLVAYGTKTETPVSRAVSDLNIPLNRAKWSNIVVHTATEADDISLRCHFVIETDADGAAVLTATQLWKDQRAGCHAPTADAEFARESIGICLVVDADANLPAGPFDTLVDLTRCLQKRCRISSASVYLNRDLAPASGSPGPQFPERAFTDSLLYIAD